MIFESVNKITSKDDFLEKIMIYIRLVEVFAERNCLVVEDVKEIDSTITSEMENIGVIECEDDIESLKRLLKKEFSRFVRCVAFYLSHKTMMGTLLDRLSNQKRRILQEQQARIQAPTFVDLFAGAGGLSCGFVQAGFKVVFANDFEDVCVRTYRFNHPELPADKVLKGDIRQIVDHIGDYVSCPVDLVVGGPPCQGFSSANQQRIIDDPRNELYKYFVKAVKSILPKFVVMENVKGMLSVANQVVEDYQNIDELRDGKHFSYKVAYKLLNSVDFSVAQSRERLIYIAIRTDVAKDKNISPESIFEQIERNNKGNKVHLLREALEYIKPLDAPRIKNMNEVDDPKTGKKST